MQLRDHPLLSRKDLPSWPPVWIPRAKVQVPLPASLHGEIGFLTRIVRSDLVKHCIFLYIREKESEYIGCLTMEDVSFCQHLYELLKTRIGKSIKEIGGIDLSYLD